MSVKIGFEVLNFKMKLREIIFCSILCFLDFPSVVLMKYNKGFGCK
jgi:hypothetical protein